MKKQGKKDIELSQHAREMLRERKISEEWLRRALEEVDRVERGPDGNLHYIKAIPEHGGRFLRVIVRPDTQPPRIITLFFDRRLRRREGEDEAQDR